RSFGKANSQSLMGIQMATAYVGTTLIPPIFGGIGGQIGYVWMPPFLLLLLALMTAMTLRLYRVVKSNWEQ
ncbi:MFS transporter, partial [Eubacteriales bacterium OttesenSCG-928-N13]|nr:MFS transporter [Eubacteriales bacterium OttesenSCG-928-N13]